MSIRSDAELERVKRVIRALQAKTEDNGCTEEEALAAAAKLGQLLEEYDLAIDEVGLREDASQCRKFEVFAADDYAGALITGLKHFCGIIAYRNTGGEGHGGKYTFFGVPHDVEIALYLYEICAEAMERDWADYMEHYGYSMKKRMSFRAGFSHRVYDRLMQMKRERDDRTRAATGTALLVLKDQLVTQEFAQRFGIKLVKVRGGGNAAADENAYRQGMSAGGRVNLNNPLGGGGADSSRITNS
jgi:hypothetical protein